RLLPCSYPPPTPTASLSSPSSSVLKPPALPAIHTLSLHDALPISGERRCQSAGNSSAQVRQRRPARERKAGRRKNGRKGRKGRERRNSGERSRKKSDCGKRNPEKRNCESEL